MPGLDPSPNHPKGAGGGSGGGLGEPGLVRPRASSPPGLAGGTRAVIPN